MVLPGAKLPDNIQSRFRQYPQTVDKNVDPNGDPFHLSLTPMEVAPHEKQAIPIPGSERPGFSAIYKSVISPDRVVTHIHPDLQTADDILRAVVAARPNSAALGERPYDRVAKSWGPYGFQTFAETDLRISNVASGIINLVEQHTGLEPLKQQYTVGLYGRNSRNWVITDYACSRTALTPVPLYDTLGPDSTKFIVNITEMPIVFANYINIENLLSSKRETPTLKVIVVLNNPDDPELWDREGKCKVEQLTEDAKALGVAVYTFGDVENIGKATPRKHRAPTPEDIFTINFTSGTTGDPKGVMLSHASLAAGITITRYNPFLQGQDGDNSYISYLPLAHIYDRTIVHSVLASGVRVGFIHGSTKVLYEDMKELKPTFFCSVPRILNRVVMSVRSSTINAPGKAGEFHRRAYAERLRQLHTTGTSDHPVLDRIWSADIRKQFGMDNVRVINTGSAPFARENVEFIKCAFGINMNEGYGLTETMGGVTVGSTRDSVIGSVGSARPINEICLRDLPSLGYSVRDRPEARGELMVRGPQLFSGYYKNVEETAKAVTEDGWFHTGDIARIDEQGRVYIIDRVKNMFKLSQGEYVAPERIEATYGSRSALVAHIYVDGDSLETYLVGIVGVDVGAFCEFAQRTLGITVGRGGLEEVFRRKEVRKAVLEQINEDVRPARLKGFELVKNVRLFVDPFTLDNGALTPTLKIKRPVCKKRFGEEMREMYQEGPLFEGSRESKI